MYAKRKDRETIRYGMGRLSQDIFSTDIGTTEFWGDSSSPVPVVSSPPVDTNVITSGFSLPSLATLLQSGANIFATLTGKAPMPSAGVVYNPAIGKYVNSLTGQVISSGQYLVPGGAGAPLAVGSPVVSVGVSQNTKNLLIMGAAVFGGVFLLKTLLGKKR